jgi:hypothetical protein
MILKFGKDIKLFIEHIHNHSLSYRLRHALSEKENAQQQRDDMEGKLNDLNQKKLVQYNLDFDDLIFFCM